MTFQAQEDAVGMLDHAVEKYRLKDRDKVLRCLRCGDKAGWTPPEG